MQLAGEWKAGLHTLTFARPGHHDALAAANVSSHEHPHGQSGALKSDRTGQHAAMPALADSMLASCGTSRPAGSASTKGSTSRPAGSASAASGASGGANLNMSGAPHGNGAE